MSPSLRLAAFLSLLAAPAALAQESAGQGTQPQLSNDLSIGKTVPQAPTPADDATYVKETNGDWDLQCLRLPEGREGEDPCQMYQLLKDDAGTSVAEVSIFSVVGGGQVVAGGTVVVPLETLLTQKLNVQVDGGATKRYDFSFCTRVGCYARLGFTQEDINRFKAGAAAKVTIVPALAPDQRVDLTMSLTGFTASFDKVTPLRQGGQ